MHASELTFGIEIETVAPNKRDEVQRLLMTEPDLSNREAAKRCGVSHTLVHRIRTERRGAPTFGAQQRTGA